MLQTLPVDGFKWIKNKIDDYHGDSNEAYIPAVYVQYIERLHQFHNDLPFLTKRMKFGKPKNFQATYMIRKKILNAKEI